MLDCAKRFFNALSEPPTRYRHAKREIIDVLKVLWDSATNPPLDELGFSRLPCDNAWPRVWWVGNGLLNILPIHASGYHEARPPQTVLDRVISSYAPTVRSLAYAKENEAQTASVVAEKALLASMPETLPFVRMEIECLKELLSKATIRTTVMENPGRLEVLSELPEHTIVHFACH